MSQNTHSLLLLFDNGVQFQRWRSLLEKLRNASDTEQPDSAPFGRVLSREWHENWFNHTFEFGPGFLKLSYDTSTHYNLPLEALEELFDGGLTAAVLEIFYDQVGETCRYHFLAKQLVDRKTIYKAHPRLPELTAAELSADDEVQDEPVEKPTPLKQLLAQETKRTADADKMVETIVHLARQARASGTNPLELARSALMLRELVIGVLQGIAFTVVTVLLFKGIWLWILLGLVLVLYLPLYRVTQLRKELGLDEDNDLEAAENAD